MQEKFFFALFFFAQRATTRPPRRLRSTCCFPYTTIADNQAISVRPCLHAPRINRSLANRPPCPVTHTCRQRDKPPKRQPQRRSPAHPGDKMATPSTQAPRPVAAHGTTQAKAIIFSLLKPSKREIACDMAHSKAATAPIPPVALAPAAHHHHQDPSVSAPALGCAKAARSHTVSSVYGSLISTPSAVA
jgi:hypothetical protein